MNIVKNKRKKANRRPKWSKTDHEFLEEEILKRFRRNLGDTLLYKGLIDSERLDNALRISKKRNQRLGITLMELGLVSEDDIVRSICEITQRPYIDICIRGYSNISLDKHDKGRLEEIKAIPIAKTPKGTVILTTIDVDEEIVEEVFGENISFVYSTESRILKCINCSDRRDLKDNKLLSMERYLEEGLINIEQGILALRYSEDKENIEEVLKTMGLLTNIKEYVKN